MFGQDQNTVPQNNLPARGTYIFANPDPNTGFTQRENYSLANHPVEHTHPTAPQLFPTLANACPDLYAACTSLHDCQRYADAPDACYAPSAPHQGPMLPPQWSPGTMPYGSAPSPSVPRACWALTGNPPYAPLVSAPTTILPSNLPSEYSPWPSSLDAQHSGSYYQGPPEATMTPYSTMTPLVAQPVMQAYPMPEYGGVGTHYSDFDVGDVSHSTFQPGQHMEPGWMETSLRQPSSNRPSRRQRREGAEPFVHQAARPGQEARQTLASNTCKTQGDDLGYKTLGQCTARCLHVPLRGPDAPPLTTGARGSKTRSRAIGGQEIPAPAPAPPSAPAPAAPRRRSLPQSDKPPAPIKLGNGRWGCPHPECGKDYLWAHDARRHYKIKHKNILWLCLTCWETVNRHDNLPRHYQAVHHRDQFDGEAVEIRRDEGASALWRVVVV
ncbi:hypothetical protein EVG20_g2981 [Dentipellis fragilis]|uniref:C2H2-type domain-containing protein n=1 Tax=Dentipellis fragilis TaxID=205917 RepID=A0A4Y9Z4T6_9AGAM|nr:hypothetical protein EVG20_g2981 [Dentipellis fragilis]